MTTAAERVAARVEAASIPFVPREERAGLPSRREIACRRCGRWTRQDPETRRWYHTDDATEACIQPADVWPEDDPGALQEATP